jgi:hypothetical protein
MFRFYSRALPGIVALLACGVSASAETLRCQSIDGNVNCVGSHGYSCQTINGKKTCVSGKGDIVQSFGNHSSETMTDDNDLKDVPAVQRWLQRHAAKPYDPTHDDDD